VYAVIAIHIQEQEQITMSCANVFNQSPIVSLKYEIVSMYLLDCNCKVGTVGIVGVDKQMFLGIPIYIT